MRLAAASRVDGLLRGGFLHAHTDGRYAAIAASIWPRADASKLRWRARATLGWSTRLACCFRRLAGNTARRLRKHTGFPNLCVFKSACRSQTLARRVSAASRRRQHASRVLHPEFSARRHCDFDASALPSGLAPSMRGQNCNGMLNRPATARWPAESSPRQAHAVLRAKRTLRADAGIRRALVRPIEFAGRSPRRSACVVGEQLRTD